MSAGYSMPVGLRDALAAELNQFADGWEPLRVEWYVKRPGSSGTGFADDEFSGCIGVKIYYSPQNISQDSASELKTGESK